MTSPAEGAPRRVLLIFPDQHRWDVLPCYGLDFMQTPNLDRLAREGMVFETAYTPSPVCQPCRASLMTGMNPLTNRVLGNSQWYPPGTPLWVRAATIPVGLTSRPSMRGAANLGE